jgi:uncharacterized damage-inducible protein DinB
MSKPDLQNVPEHLHEEIVLVPEDDLRTAFAAHTATIEFFRNIPEEKWNHSYAEGKWTVKGVVQHVIDGERIFCNRALVIARQDKDTPLPSFDEQLYGATASADRRTKADLLSELETVQQSSKKLFASFSDEQLNAKGMVSNYTTDVNTLGFVVIGHCLHHMKILKERYL